MLLSSSDKISRQRAQVATAGVVAGSLVVLYLFIGTTANAGWHLDKRYWDKQSVLLCAVLVGPTIVGLRKVILLWKNPPF